MSKVLIERPRWRHADPSKKTGQRIHRYDPGDEYEDLPQREPASKGRGTKQFTDLLGPLVKFLRSNVGRPWDKVYSELCAHLDRRKTTGRHVFQHLEGYVEVDCFVGADGEIYANTQRRGVRRIGTYGRYQNQFYVHPKTALLCVEVPRPAKSEKEDRKRAERRQIERIQINHSQSHVRINGVWYLGDYVETDGNPPKYPKPPTTSSSGWHQHYELERHREACKQLEEFGTRYWNGRRWMQLLSKRKYSQQELQKAGLKNANPAR